MILRGLGVIGGPGMALTSAVVFALDGAGLIDDVAMITEGQLSGLVNKGLVVGEASPEAAAGGPLAFVENGDRITDRRHPQDSRSACARSGDGAPPLGPAPIRRAKPERLAADLPARGAAGT